MESIYNLYYNQRYHDKRNIPSNKLLKIDFFFTNWIVQFKIFILLPKNFYQYLCVVTI